MSVWECYYHALRIRMSGPSFLPFSHFQASKRMLTLSGTVDSISINGFLSPESTKKWEGEERWKLERCKVAGKNVEAANAQQTFEWLPNKAVTTGITTNNQKVELHPIHPRSLILYFSSPELVFCWLQGFLAAFLVFYSPLSADAFLFASALWCSVNT